MQKEYLTKFKSTYDKNSQEMGMEGIYLNTLKVVYEKPAANMIHSDEKLKAFP